MSAAPTDSPLIEDRGFAEALRTLDPSVAGIVGQRPAPRQALEVAFRGPQQFHRAPGNLLGRIVIADPFASGGQDHHPAKPIDFVIGTARVASLTLSPVQPMRSRSKPIIAVGRPGDDSRLNSVTAQHEIQTQLIAMAESL